MKNWLLQSISITLTLLIGLFVSAHTGLAQNAPRLEIQLRAFNITQNQDATLVNNRAGDIIQYTADVKNLGPQDLVDYSMRIYIADLLRYGSLVDLGTGVIEGDYIVYPPILQSASCNCNNDNYFKIKLKSNVCEVTSLRATYEDITVIIPVRCEAPPAPTRVPRTPTNGPSEVLLFSALGAIVTVTILILRKRRKKETA